MSQDPVRSAASSPTVSGQERGARAESTGEASSPGVLNGQALARAVKGMAGVAVAVLLWELVRGLVLQSSASAPAFSTVVGSIVDQIAHGSMLSDVASTLLAWALGLGIAMLVAVPAGLAVGLSQWADAATRVVVEFLRPIPSVALVPVAILFAGIGLQMKLILIVFACFWPLFFNTKYGVGQTDPLLVETARAFGKGPLRVVLEIVVPSALPSVATGVRIAASIALILTVVAEMVAGGGGLGHLILSNRDAGQVPAVYAGILVVGLLGYAINAAALTAQRHLLAWSPDNRKDPR